MNPQLPPPALSDNDEAHGQIVAHVDGLVLESYQRQTELNLWQRSQANMELYLYGRRKGQNSGKVRANKIQSQCNANAAIQTATPPKIVIRQRTTGEPPRFYFNPAAAPPDPRWAGIDPTTPLSIEEVQSLQMMIAQSAQAAAVTGQAPLIDPAVLVRVDDASVREALEVAVQSKFEEGGGVQMTRQSVLYGNIFGYQYHLANWRDDKRLPDYRALECVVVHADFTRTDIEHAAYAVVDEFLGRDEALQLNPDPAMQQAINDNAAAGRPMLAGRTPYALPYYWFQKYFYREVVIVRTAWIRNQPYPLSPDEAVASGKVIARQVPDESAAPNPAQDDVPQPVPGRTGNATPADGGGGDDVPGSGVQPGAPRLVFHAVGDDGSPVAGTDGQPEEIDQRHPNWPTRMSIREIKVIAGKLFQDKECERSTIPLLHNVNIEIPFTPFGQGEPERLESLQRGHSNVLTDIVVNGDFSTTPATFLPRSVIKENPELGKGAYVTPNKIYVVNDATWQMFQGKFIATSEAPATPADQWKREGLLRSLMTEVSDQQDVVRGQSPTAGASGKLVNDLYSAATTSITFKSQRTEDMLIYNAKLLAGDIIMRETPEELAEDFPKWGVPIWAEIHRRWMAHYLWCPLSVEIASGSASARQQRANTLINAKIQQVPVSDPEILQAMDLDPEEQIAKQVKFERERMFAMQGMGGMPGGAPQQPGAPGTPPQPAAAQAAPSAA